jgi:hypothetical protein
MTAGHGFETIRIARSAAADRVASPRRLAWGITAGAAALSLVLASALPARAGDKDDLAKALIAALVVGAIIHETRKDDRPAPPVVVPAPEPVHKKKKRKHPPVIPSACALEFEGERRSVTVYPESCLLDYGVESRLPRYCAKEARIYGEWDRIYSEKCLREAGFKLQRPR